MKEVWRNIPDCRGVYKASNFGRVKSLKYGKERILKPWRNKHGYVYVHVCFKGVKMLSCKVHRLIISAFRGKKEMAVDHINGKKDDNRLANLEYVTRRENKVRARKLAGKFIGASYHKSFRASPWRARINRNGKCVLLGYYKTKGEAQKVYQKTFRELEKRDRA
jgi:hypothetical protein